MKRKPKREWLRLTMSAEAVADFKQRARKHGLSPSRFAEKLITAEVRKEEMLRQKKSG
jgi:hypothetical protein